MATTNNWFPSSRQERFALISKTTAFTSVAGNRALIGFAADTPNGVWFDTDYMPKLTAYDTNYRIWNTPSTSTPMDKFWRDYYWSPASDLEHAFNEHPNGAG